MPITSATSTYTICTLHTLLIYISQDLGTGEDDVSFLNHHLSSLCSCLSNSESGLTQMSYLSSFFPCSLSEMFIDSMNPIKNNVVQGSCPWGSVLFLLPGQAINCQPLIYALDPTHPGAGSTGASLSLRWSHPAWPDPEFHLQLHQSILTSFTRMSHWQANIYSTCSKPHSLQTVAPPDSSLSLLPAISSSWKPCPQLLPPLPDRVTPSSLQFFKSFSTTHILPEPKVTCPRSLCWTSRTTSSSFPPSKLGLLPQCSGWLSLLPTIEMPSFS